MASIRNLIAYLCLGAFVFIVFSPAIVAYSEVAKIAGPQENSREYALERSKFEFNSRLEQDKLEIEKLKAWLTGLSVLIPLVIGMTTLLWQSRSTLKLKKRDAIDSFQLKAAELVLGSATPAVARNRANALKNLFPDYIPANFGESFDFTKLPGIRAERKLELIKMFVQNPEQNERILNLWIALFPEEEEWLQKCWSATGIGTEQKVPASSLSS